MAAGKFFFFIYCNFNWIFYWDLKIPIQFFWNFHFFFWYLKIRYSFFRYLFDVWNFDFFFFVLHLKILRPLFEILISIFKFEIMGPFFWDFNLKILWNFFLIVDLLFLCISEKFTKIKELDSRFSHFFIIEF